MTIKQDFLIKIIPKILLLSGFVLCLTELVCYGLIIIALSVGFLARHHIVWAPEPVKSNREIGYSGCTEPVVVPAAAPVVFPKPDKCVAGVLIESCTTSKQYQIESMNEYGLTWHFDNDHNIHIRQKMDYNPDDGSTYQNWLAIGFFPDHAITEVHWVKTEKITEKITEKTEE